MALVRTRFGGNVLQVSCSSLIVLMLVLFSWWSLCFLKTRASVLSSLRTETGSNAVCFSCSALVTLLLNVNAKILNADNMDNMCGA